MTIFKLKLALLTLLLSTCLTSFAGVTKKLAPITDTGLVPRSGGSIEAVWAGNQHIFLGVQEKPLLSGPTGYGSRDLWMLNTTTLTASLIAKNAGTYCRNRFQEKAGIAYYKQIVGNQYYSPPKIGPTLIDWSSGTPVLTDSIVDDDTLCLSIAQKKWRDASSGGKFIYEELGTGEGILKSENATPLKTTFVKPNGDEIEIAGDFDIKGMQFISYIEFNHVYKFQTRTYDFAYLTEDGEVTYEKRIPFEFRPEGGDTSPAPYFTSWKWKEGFLILVSDSKFNGFYYQKITNGLPDKPILIAERDKLAQRFGFRLSPDGCGLILAKIPNNPLRILTSTPTIHYVNLCAIFN